MLMWILSVGLFASVGSELVGYGTFLVGIGTVMGIVSKRITDSQNVSRDQMMKELQTLKTESHAAIEAHVKKMMDHVTASRAQTTRYIDRKVETLAQNQDIMLSMIAEVDSKVTKKANSRTVRVSTETKGV